jgi:hypothetical protein
MNINMEMQSKQALTKTKVELAMDHTSSPLILAIMRKNMNIAYRF